MKIIFPAFRYNYGKKERGESIEKLVILPALKENADVVISFWLEDNGYPKKKKELQKRILDFIDKEKPDVIFCILMKDEIEKETIEQLSKRYITINWFCDDQWRFKYFTKFVAPLFTHPITVDKYSVPMYKDIGCKNIILSQWAAQEYKENINFNNLKYKYDISFVGGKNSTREWYINEIIKTGHKVECFGHGWDNGSVSNEQMKNIFLHSKINLNLSNSYSFDTRINKYIRSILLKSLINLKNFYSLEPLKKVKQYLLYKNSLKSVEQIKMRNFEIPAYGGFQLSMFALEIEDYFIIGQEIAVYSNIDELKRQLEYFLENDFEREKIRKAGYLKSREYTFAKQFEKIFSYIKL